MLHYHRRDGHLVWLRNPRKRVILHRHLYGPFQEIAISTHETTKTDLHYLPPMDAASAARTGAGPDRRPRQGKFVSFVITMTMA